MAAILVVALYVLVSAPLLFLLLKVHGLKSDYTGWFIAALVLQLVPIGLFFFPLGFIGVAMLAGTLAGTWRRNRMFRAMGIDNPEVARRWQAAYVFNLWALGFALEQKGVAYLFLDVVGRRGFGFVWTGLVPLTVAVWSVLGLLLVQARRERLVAGRP